jgi:predicted Holliday junction resolvase-like endonuclease
MNLDRRRLVVMLSLVAIATILVASATIVHEASAKFNKIKGKLADKKEEVKEKLADKKDKISEKLRACCPICSCA